jgi:hypothetical protein
MTISVPELSVVVVAYCMVRELPRTLQSLGAGYQTGVADGAVEVLVVDNGSPDPLPVPEGVGRIRLDPAPPSPARAANAGIAAARADLVGLIIDGARMASPGLCATALLAQRLSPRPVIATLGWHLGAVRHMDARAEGYDEAVEDQLLADTDWLADGYRLFGISTLAGSSGRGWFGPMGESSALFMPKAMWAELGGLDEAFALPGGGLVNHDLYRRACALPDAQLVVMLGEGTFHQIHGGAATSRRYSWDEMHADYEQIRGRSYRPPVNDPLFVGRVPESSLAHVEESVRLAKKRNRKRSAAKRTLTT